VELIVTPGQAHDITQASRLLGDHEPHYLIADKGYDSDDFIAHLERRGGTAVIPSRAGRTVTRRLLRRHYRRRNRVERFVKPHQTLSSGGHTLRKNRSKLPGLRPARGAPLLDPLNVNRT